MEMLIWVPEGLPWGGGESEVLFDQTVASEAEKGKALKTPLLRCWEAPQP